MRQPKLDVQHGTVTLPCASANLRRAARIVSQRYDQELRPSGVKGTQFTLLQALDYAGAITQGTLGDVLGLDSTTLTRTLALLRKKGWVHATPGEDRRQVRLALTEKGKKKYQGALPYWQCAQEQLRKALGNAGWEQLVQATVRTAAVARQD